MFDILDDFMALGYTIQFKHEAGQLHLTVNHKDEEYCRTSCLPLDDAHNHEARVIDCLRFMYSEMLEKTMSHNPIKPKRNE